MTSLTVATCQFSVSADIAGNAAQIKRQMTRASRGGARVVHFPEGALSGYAGIDFETFAGFDWDALRQATSDIAEHARDLGALICYDYRFPELYREYARRGVQVVFHSFHAANASPERIEAISQAIGPRHRSLNPAATFTFPGITMPAAMTAAAASNHVWISCPNSSAPESYWPAFFVRADGITTGRLRRNVAGVLLSTVDTTEDLYDSTGPWRQGAIAGTLHSGALVSDPRSDDRTSA